jgi:hypothetical protein
MFVQQLNRFLRCLRLPFALALTALCLAAFGGTTAPPATSELTAQDVEIIKELFARLSDGFTKADAAEIITLFGTHDTKRRDKIQENLTREFQQVRYVDFAITSIIPDETMAHNRHSIDVTMHMVTEDLRRGGGEAKTENSTTETFIVHRQENGSFVLMDSPLFDKLGLQQGVGLVVDGLLAVMGLIAGLAFWVWMGFEVHRARPRSAFWRALVFMPVVGPLAFFIVKYLPNQLIRQPATE